MQVARDVLQIAGDLSLSLKPLGDGLNFMSDAFFVEITHESGVKHLFVKVFIIHQLLIIMSFRSSLHLINIDPNCPMKGATTTSSKVDISINFVLSDHPRTHPPGIVVELHLQPLL